MELDHRSALRHVLGGDLAHLLDSSSTSDGFVAVAVLSSLSPLRRWRMSRGIGLGAAAAMFDMAAEDLGALERWEGDPAPFAKRIYMVTRGEITPDSLHPLAAWLTEASASGDT